MMNPTFAPTKPSRQRTSRCGRRVLACALATGSTLLSVHAADGVALPAPSAPRMVQLQGTMMWVLDSPAAASPSAPTVLPVLDTRVVEGRHIRVLRTPAAAAATGTGAMTPRSAPFEQILPNGGRVLTLPMDATAAPAAHPALVERFVDPRQTGTPPGDFPAPNTLYRLAPPR